MTRTDDANEPGGPVAPSSWLDDYGRLSRSDAAELSADELEVLADAAWMVCRLDESLAFRQQAYVRYVETRDDRSAARAAWRLFWDHLYGDETTIAAGWLRRGRRHLAALPEAAEHGFIALADAELALNHGELDEAETYARRAIDIGDRNAVQRIVALGLALLGRILIARRRLGEGCASLDEAMTLVVSGQLDDYFAGAVYCALIGECREIVDIRRGSEWTDAARAWSATLPATTPFHGICRIYRGEILCLRGDWDEAEAEIRAAADELAAFKPRSAAVAYSALGELYRRRGDLAAAEVALRRAHELGGDPQPGLALVRLAQGQATAARSALRAALDAPSRSPTQRAELLGAHLEATLAVGDVAAARAASDELCSIAGVLDQPAVHARALMARGAVRMAEEDHRGALSDLRAACGIWSELGLPYEEAQTRMLIGSVAASLDDEEAETLEIQAACAGFERLGAGADLQRARALLPGRSGPAGLTAREVDVLRLIAAGCTNRAIAAELVISQHTANRHVQNIFTKLGVSSRAAATAFAVKRHLA